MSGFPPYLQDFRRAKPATFAISLGRAQKKVTETSGHSARSLYYRAVFSKKGSFLAGFPAHLPCQWLAVICVARRAVFIQKRVQSAAALISTLCTYYLFDVVMQCRLAVSKHALHTQ
jgi:hypothetical protein